MGFLNEGRMNQLLCIFEKMLEPAAVNQKYVENGMEPDYGHWQEPDYGHWREPKYIKKQACVKQIKKEKK